MDYQVIKINDSTWRIEDGGVRMFLLAGTEKALLIDTGMNITNAKEIAESLTDLPILLFNTHADRDHVAGNAAFDSFMMNPAEASNFYNTYGGDGKIVPVADGQELDLGGRLLKFIYIPGHTPGSTAVLDVNAGVLIPGDPFQKNGSIFMFGVQREMHAYILSCEKLMNEYAGAFTEIWPSHADLPIPADTVGILKEAAEKVLAGEIEGVETDFRGNLIHVYDAGIAKFLGN